MTERLEVRHTDINDADTVFTFFEHSIRYQEKHGYPVWKNYDRSAVIEDIRKGNHYKVVRGAEIAIAFSVCYSDKIIWQELERGDALYLHRIVVNPEFKGQKLFGNILAWAIDECKRRNLKYVRMDTWADNTVIKNYYLGFGFHVIRNVTTPDVEELPIHNRNLALTLLQYGGS